MRVLLPSGANDFKHGVTQASGDAILELLKKYKSIAVVGLSSNPTRPSFGVTEYMKCAARLEDVPEKIEIVNVFRRAEDVPLVVESAIRVGAKVVWMQSGIENEAAAERARAAGIVVIEDACILVEHRRRVGELKR